MLHYLKRILAATPDKIGWGHALPFAVALLPIVIMVSYATPQLTDFCVGRFMHDGFWDGLINQFNVYGHQFMGRTLNMLPIAIVTWLSIDYFYLYALLCLLALAGFLLLASRVVHELLPASSAPMHLFAVVLLTIALIGNAPAARDMVFSLPGFFTYALPGLVMAMMFMVLYHSLAAQRALTWQEHVIVLLGTCYVSLSNEWSGLALVALLLCSFLTRLRLVPDAPEPITHAAALCLSLFGATLILLGPSQPIFGFDHAGMGLAWSLFFTPEFFVLRLPLPGVLAWLLFLAFTYRPELRGNSLSDRHRALAHFAFFSLFLISFIAFVFGYLPDESRLRARGQNQLYILVLVALSILFCLVVPVIRYRLTPLIDRYAPALRRIRVLPVIIVLALLSPAWLMALAQVDQADTFRSEQRTRLGLLMNRAEQTVFLPPLSVRPSLLADRDISGEAGNWANSCVADFFKAEKVLPQPDNL
ncbi:MAG: hypothetical protein AB7G06_04550 [Bdellovibrionales bacterium]